MYFLCFPASTAATASAATTATAASVPRLHFSTSKGWNEAKSCSQVVKCDTVFCTIDPLVVLAPQITVLSFLFYSFLKKKKDYIYITVYFDTVM